MIPLGSLSGGAPPGMQPPIGGPPMGAPPQMQPPTMPRFNDEPLKFKEDNLMQPPTAVRPETRGPDMSEDAGEYTLAEVGKTARDYLDVLMPVAIPKVDEDGES